jgi:putative acetyltransferase
MNVDYAIRPELPADQVMISEVHHRAFGRSDEARLVDALRRGGFARLSLVAERGEQVLAHILFSDLPIVTSDGTVSALALAPLSVLPEFQRHGIGSTLVQRGLELCREQGHRVVVVLGHPKFYSRFGFSADLATPLRSAFSGRASFMAAELVPDALAGVAGVVQYSPPFDTGATVRPICSEDAAEWLRMRSLLWPESPASEHAAEIRAYLASGAFPDCDPYLSMAVFVAIRLSTGLCGFVEVSIRSYAPGCTSRPVGYLEGWFVDADVRRLGIGKRLVAAAEQWTAAQKCQEMASDAHPDNAVSLAAHAALGFDEIERAVHLRKRLGRTG